MEAKVGSNPSFDLRSLLAGKKLLEADLVWRISNGKIVRIWKDSWLSTAPAHKIHSPIHILGENATISNLIIEDQQVWNIPLLQFLFPQE